MVQAPLSICFISVIWYLFCKIDEKAFCLQIERWEEKTRFLSIMLLVPMGTIKKIWNRLMKNLLTQGRTEEENRKIYKVWLVKNFQTYK